MSPLPVISIPGIDHDICIKSNILDLGILSGLLTCQNAREQNRKMKKDNDTFHCHINAVEPG